MRSTQLVWRLVQLTPAFQGAHRNFGKHPSSLVLKLFGEGFTGFWVPLCCEETEQSQILKANKTQNLCSVFPNDLIVGLLLLQARVSPCNWFISASFLGCNIDFGLPHGGKETKRLNGHAWRGLGKIVRQRSRKAEVGKKTTMALETAFEEKSAPFEKNKRWTENFLVSQLLLLSTGTSCEVFNIL